MRTYIVECEKLDDGSPRYCYIDADSAQEAVDYVREQVLSDEYKVVEVSKVCKSWR